MKTRRQDNEIVPALSGKEALILDMLLATPSNEKYGLELVSESKGKLKRGTVYVTLSRMEDKGFVESKQEEPTPGVPGIPRRLYRVTGYGLRVFQALELARETRRLAVAGAL